VGAAILVTSINPSLVATLPSAFAANAAYHHFSFQYFEAIGHAHKGHMYIIEALGSTAAAAYKMYMIVVVVALLAAALAQGIAGGTIGTGYGVDNAFFGKSLQAAINGNPVDAGKAVFNIAVAQGTCFLLQKQLQNEAPAVRYTQAVSL
jgi:hypothetical protein